MRSLLRVAGLGVALALSACGGKTVTGRVFDPSWENDGGRSFAALQQRLGRLDLPVGPALAVGVVDGGIVGLTVKDGERWRHDGALDARPVIAGEVVVLSGGGFVTALEASSGKRLWQVPAEGRALRGAGDDGAVTAVSLGRPGGSGSLLLAVDRTGQVVQRLEPEVSLGTPAVARGILFIPWGNQYVSAVQLSSGDEIARLVTREQVSHALNVGGDLYFGERTLLRFDEQIARASRGAARQVELPARKLPGEPRWFDPGHAITPPEATPRSKIQLVARPALTPAGLGVSGNRLAATYYRLVLGLSADRGAVAWVKTLPDDLLAGAAADGGFLLCDAGGGVFALDAGGSPVARRNFGTELRGCTLQAGGYRPTTPEAPPPLVEQLQAAVELRDARLVPMQLILLDELAAAPDALATKALIDVAANPHATVALARRASALIAKRRTGAEYMLQALKQHYDFLADTLTTPPVGPLADALAAMRDERAAPLLAQHLNDPANSTLDVARAARALETLATPAEYDALKTFFALYRATADEAHLIQAVLSAARALLRVGGDDGHAVIERASRDPLTLPEIQRGLNDLTIQPPAKGEAPKSQAATLDARAR